MAKLLTPTQTLKHWAASEDKTAADFARETGYQYNYTTQLFRGDREITPETLGWICIVYGGQVAEPIAAAMRAAGVTKKTNGGE
ncbi:MAG TPA: hypothetical protein VIK33_17450 [Anaerolineae bacterium]